MATDSGVDIDLYAGVDDLENEISGQEALSGPVDLYEDVLTTGGEIDPEQEVLQPQDEEYTETAEVHQPVQAPVPGSTYEYKSYTTIHPKSTQAQTQSSYERPRGRPLYVGNLTWWTTDQQLTDALQECGVTDLVNIKFFDNRTNGQSKGFAMIELGSETSIRLVGERLPKMELHGQHPQVTPATKQHLHEFEAQSRKNNPNASNDRGPPGHDGRDYQSGGGRGGFNHHAGFRGRGGMPPQGRGFDYRMPGAHMQGPRIPPPGMPHFGQPPRPFQRPQAMHGMPPPPPGEVPMPPMSAPMPMPPPPPGVMNMQDHRMWGERPAMVPPMIKPPVAPHVNPAFFPEGPTQLAASGMGRMDMLSQFQPRPGDDYTESMKRNQALASTAIKRAMSDANAGDYESGIETLVRAISLIKQSPSAQEETCQVLVQSLQDCLQGLEAQLLKRKTSRKESHYDDKEDGDRERKHRKRRSRSRSRSRERSSKRSGSRERRSRSRERHRRR